MGNKSRILTETLAKTKILIEALPFIKEYAGKRVVVKVGGEILENPLIASSIAEDLTLLNAVGIDIVLCHGGGPQISKMMKSVGKEAVFLNGLRVTDAETLEITSMVLLGTVNRQIVALLNGHGTKALGLSGVDAGLIKVEPESSELGYVGKITQIQIAPVVHLVEKGFLPVIASLGSDTKGQTYNINADLAAGKLAAELGAEKLIILSNVEGLYETFGDANSLIPEINSHSLRKLSQSGTLTAGMIPKIEGVLAALDGGVKRAHLLDGRVEHSILLEVFTTEGIGTMITHGGN